MCESHVVVCPRLSYIIMWKIVNCVHMLCRLYGLHMGNSQHGCCVVQFKILCYYAINSYYPNMSLFTSFSVSKCIMGYIASIMTLFEYYTHVTHHLYG